MNKKYRNVLGFIAIVSILLPSCVPICFSKSIVIFKNRTDDTLFIGASHHNAIDSVGCLLRPAYLSTGNELYPSKVRLWNAIDDKSEIVYPDSSFVIYTDYLFDNTDTCYFFLVKWKDAKNHSWDEICTKKLYSQRVIIRDSNGKFEQTIY